MAVEQGSFEQVASVYPVRAYSGIVLRVEGLISPDAVDWPKLVGQSGKHYKVEQRTISKKRDSFDSKTTLIYTETECWTLAKGTGTDHESLTDGLVYQKTERGQRIELGQWNHGEYWRDRNINVNVFRKFDELFEDLETPQAPSTAEGVSPKAAEVITRVTIGPEFIDQYGHVNYKRFPYIFEAGQNDLMESCIEGGFDGVDSAYGVRNLVKTWTTTINGQILAGDKVLLFTSIGRLGTTSITYRQRMEKDGQNVADHSMVVVVVDKDDKPIPIPEDLRAKLQSYLIESHRTPDLINKVDTQGLSKGELVWLKLNENVEFLKYPKSSREAMRPLVEAMPTILADMLDEPADLTNIMRAKIKFISYGIENGVITAAIKAAPEDQRSLFEDITTPGELEEMFRKLIDRLTAMTADIPGLLQKLGVTEQQLMLSPQMNLNPEARGLYETGQLTIGKLLLIDPMVIYKSSDN